MKKLAIIGMIALFFTGCSQLQKALGGKPLGFGFNLGKAHVSIGVDVPTNSVSEVKPPGQ